MGGGGFPVPFPAPDCKAWRGALFVRLAAWLVLDGSDCGCRSIVEEAGEVASRTALRVGVKSSCVHEYHPAATNFIQTLAGRARYAGARADLTSVGY